MVIKTSNHQENTIINIYVPKNRDQKIQETKLKEENKRSPITFGDNTLFSIMDRTTRQRVNEEIEDLNNNIMQLILTHTYRAPNTTTEEQAFF